MPSDSVFDGEFYTAPYRLQDTGACAKFARILMMSREARVMGPIISRPKEKNAV